MGYRIIYLVGFMGCGKSTAGKKLAGILGWQFLDLDSIIEKKYSLKIEEIFILSGEKTFREYESDTLRSLDLKGDTIISVGGGAPCFGDNMTYMKQTGKVIYIRMTPAQLKERLVADNKPRPLIAGLDTDQLEKFIEIKLSEREIFYLRAGEIIDGFGLDINDLALRVKKNFSK